MKNVQMTLCSIVAFAVIASHAVAQPPEGRGPGGRGGPPEGRGGPGGPDGPPPSPILEALDADGDQEISTAELEKATAALKKLDRNRDGKLTRDELRPAGRGRPGAGGRGAGGRGAGGRGADGRGADGRGAGAGGGPAAGGRGTGGRGPAAASVFVKRILGFDENKDGKVSKDELPERMHGLIERNDGNKDGVLDKEELAQMSAGAARNREGGRIGRGTEGRPGPGAGGRGAGGRGRPAAGGPEGRTREGGGGPNPERFAEQAFRFDADKDGKLSRDELRKFAEEFARRGPPGREGVGRGGVGRGPGDRGGRPEGGEGGRPRRPSRPDAE